MKFQIILCFLARPRNVFSLFLNCIFIHFYFIEYYGLQFSTFYIERVKFDHVFHLIEKYLYMYCGGICIGGQKAVDFFLFEMNVDRKSLNYLLKLLVVVETDLENYSNSWIRLVFRTIQNLNFKMISHIRFDLNYFASVSSRDH